jgi:hypothetical protein
VIYRLYNQKNPNLKLTLTGGAWRWLLEAARECGWVPMGTVHENVLVGMPISIIAGLAEEEPGDGTYTPSSSRLVMLEDALNLMDALERVFVNYMPLPERSRRGMFREDWDELRDWYRPGIGCLLALLDFCRGGSFIIENPARIK